jgi:DNA-binding transcriptional MerR regulator
MTIGEVVQKLQGAHPDLSISKLRFLEEEGLITPERTAGGYRKFSPGDVNRVDMILRLQRDHFLPLAIIKTKLADADKGRLPAELQSTPVGGTQPLPFNVIDEGPLDIEDSQSSLGIPLSFLKELNEFGLIEFSVLEDGRTVVDRAEVPSMHAAWDLRRFGVEPRHLRMYSTFADREATLFAQILMPAFRHRTAETRQKLGDTLNELCTLTDQLKGRLLRRALEKAFEDLP